LIAISPLNNLANMAGKAAQWEKLKDDLRNYRVGSCVGGVQQRLDVNDLAMVSVFSLFPYQERWRD
jgi:hypothetical protein